VIRSFIEQMYSLGVASEPDAHDRPACSRTHAGIHSAQIVPNGVDEDRWDRIRDLEISIHDRFFTSA
jgi:hypothetical protein